MSLAHCPGFASSVPNGSCYAVVALCALSCDFLCLGAVADGELQRHVWCEVLALAAAALSAGDAAEKPRPEAGLEADPYGRPEEQAAGQPASARNGKAAKPVPASAANGGAAAVAPRQAAAAASDTRERQFAGFMGAVRRLLAAGVAQCASPLSADMLQLKVGCLCLAMLP